MLDNNIEEVLQLGKYLHIVDYTMLLDDDDIEELQEYDYEEEINNDY